MPDALRSYLSRLFDYGHPNHRRACAKTRTRSRGHCQTCGYGRAEHAHHWALRYPPPEATTPDDLTGLCRFCHYIITLFRKFLAVGGDPVRFLEIFEKALVEAGDTTLRTGRARCIGRAWGACVSGRSKPHVGEVLKVTLRSGAWDFFIVTAIVDGEPGRWRVLTVWPKSRERCTNRVGR